jgi:hypothetical protein
MNSISYVTLSAACISLVGCGGGGGSPTVIQYDYTLGTASTLSAARSALTGSASMSLPYDAPDGTSYSSLSAAHSTLNGGSDPIATVDTGAATAWADGWTGKNVKVGMVDDFNSNGRVDSHGDYTTTITGSVAPEATLTMADISTTSGSLSLTQANTAFNSLEASGHRIFNNSWGISRGGSYTTSFDSDVASLVSAYSPSSGGLEGLYIWAAGNNATTCGTSSRVEDCNLFAAYVDGVRDAGYSTVGDRHIWVGSLADGTDTIANYSLRAGDLKYDFIVAHDDVLTSGDAAGTSYAAPRVTGAAALVKQKFPNLTSAQIKQVLLQTATDIGAPGVDEIYGYGKLNIAGTMSPSGTVTPR